MSTPTPMGPGAVNPPPSALAGLRPSQPESPLKGLGQRVCRHFLDFLETDFKRQQAPRRRILGRTESGQPTSINLRKYRKLYEEIWKAAAKPLNEASRFSITRKAYTAHLSPILQDLIAKHVASIEERLFEEAWTAGIEIAGRNRFQAAKDIEKYVEEVLAVR